ncbi:MAG: hypothetical protein ACJ797_03825 [Ktedonobacteraceae bacterium]
MQKAHERVLTPQRGPAELSGWGPGRPPACPTRAPTGGGWRMAARASRRCAWRFHGDATLHWDQAGRGACAGPRREERLSQSSIWPHVRHTQEQ